MPSLGATHLLADIPSDIDSVGARHPARPGAPPGARGLGIGHL